MRRTPKILITIGLLVGLAPLAVAIVADRPGAGPHVPVIPEVTPLPPKTDRTEDLRACRDRGAAALDHPPCLRLWSEQRDWFLGVAEPETSADPSSLRQLIDPPDGPHPPPGHD